MHSLEPTPPNGNGQESHPTVRVVSEIDLSPAKRFILPKKKKYEPQYAHVYFSRLKSLTAHVLKSAKLTFGEGEEGKLQYSKRIADIASKDEMETVVVGVIFRHMKSKPSILAQYDVPSHELIPAPPDRATCTYPRDDDEVFIEDEYGRCALDLSQLDSAVATLSLVTGFVLALKGHEDRRTGSFKVNAISYAGQAPQKSLPELPGDKFICITSALSFGKADGDVLAAELLMEFLRGSAGEDPEGSTCANIVQLIVAGNSVPQLEDTESGPSAVLAAHRPLKSGEKERVAAPIVEVDRFLSVIASSLPVAVMPGEADPVNYLLPQQPFHRCLLPSSSRNENLARVPNPFECSVDKRVILGTSGQPVTDFALYEDQSSVMKDGKEAGKLRPSGEKVLDILTLMLQNRHLAPTCPDTLASFPFSDGSDPFVLESTPHVFFAGNQREYASRLVRTPHVQTQASSGSSMDIDGVQGGEKTVRIVSVPRFDETGQVVLVNLRTLDCIVREFALTM
ncbi:unnamed protein product [Chondrus crispus]|uniref:DNA polymerase delta small subunit n=1 Tax=Chondrus crispus TaxID=2769 RepID=R7Q512_CHOCR|nr:unnamed protein product [Chondrus crispus]CDF32451.1 unnamed protein product [Chondrus crispus]|eukprot:XP_005712116.1 unnamed protein product [Chondrus crispus]